MSKTPVSGLHDAALMCELGLAMRISRFAPRRMRLRELAAPILAEQMRDDTIAAALKLCPYVPGQVDPRPTVSGFRDSLTPISLICLVHAMAKDGPAAVERELDGMHTALAMPGEYGVKTSTSGGWAFARWKEQSDARLARIEAEAWATLDAARHTATSTETDGMDDRSPSIDLDTIPIYEILCAARIAARKAGVGIEASIDLLKRMQGGRFAKRAEAVQAMHADMPESDEDGRRTASATRLAELLVAALQSAEQTRSRLRPKSTRAGKGAEPVPVSSHAFGIALPDPDDARLIDMTLERAGLPPIEQIIGRLHGALDRIDTLHAELEAERSRPVPVTATAGTAAPVGAVELPEGEVTMRKAHEVFGLDTEGGKGLLHFEVPVFVWEAPHPHVPMIDPDYIFRPAHLFKALRALKENRRMYLHGHTGSGKTSFIEQIAGRLNWPFMRINFDSEITRMDLIGRDKLDEVNGATVSSFVDGILPQVLSHPYLACFDELDFVRPDVAYVMQRALEGEGLLLTEDGGRMVHPHQWSRLFATGNTVGQGDEHGMYQGARAQSMALLDRFSVWAHVEYLNPDERKALLQARVPGLTGGLLAPTLQYVTEHIEAFTAGKVLQPLTPRGFVGLGQALVEWTGAMPLSMQRTAIYGALGETVLDRATAQDKAVLRGIANRVFGSE